MFRFDGDKFLQLKLCEAIVVLSSSSLVMQAASEAFGVCVIVKTPWLWSGNEDGGFRVEAGR